MLTDSDPEYHPRVDREALQALQAPLKQRYRDDSDAALITLEATATLDEGVSCSVQTGRAIAVAGLHPGDRRRRVSSVLWRHAARSACRLRRGHAASGRHIAWHLR